ncbi:protein kinase [bacterium]|nr:protein kinase [bacterium]
MSDHTNEETDDRDLGGATGRMNQDKENRVPKSSRADGSGTWKLSPQSTLQKMAEFSGEVSIFESQSLTLPGEKHAISSDRFETLTFPETLADDEGQISRIEIKERKQRRLKEVKDSHAELRKLSEEESMMSRYQKLSSIKKQEAQRDPLVGAVLANKYNINGIVGKGANATVYRANRLSDNATVAIKTIRNKSFEDVVRFNLEIDAMERMSHPSLVHYIDCIRLDQGNIFLVMELIKGISLQEVLKIHGPIVDEETIWDILFQVSDALKHAHEKGIVHRDLKSGNVVLSKEINQPLSVKVLDFGLAKHHKAANVTMHGTTLGSPLYMSPEQCRGEEPTAQSDVYSIGIMTYEVVSGVVPFIGETITEIMAAHCDPEMTHIPVSEVCPELKAADLFDRLLYKALNVHTAFRFQDMTEFQESLNHWIETVRSRS